MLSLVNRFISSSFRRTLTTVAEFPKIQGSPHMIQEKLRVPVLRKDLVLLNRGKLILASDPQYNIRITDLVKKSTFFLQLSSRDSISGLFCRNDILYVASGRRVLGWNLETRTPTLKVDSSIHLSNQAFLSENDTMLAVGGPDGKVELFQKDKGDLIEEISHNRKMLGMSFIGSTLVTVSQSHALVWKFNESGNFVYPREHEEFDENGRKKSEKILAFAPSENGYVTLSKKQASFWNSEGRCLGSQAHGLSGRVISASYHGDHLSLVSSKGEISLLSSTNLNQKWFYNLPKANRGVCIESIAIPPLVDVRLFDRQSHTLTTFYNVIGK